MKPAAYALALAILLALTGCGGADKQAKKDPFAAIPKRTTTAPTNEASPRFEQIAALDGSGTARKSVQVSGGALRWRTRARCGSGQVTVTVSPRPSSGPASAAEPCSGSKDTIWSGTGAQQLSVQASGAWHLIVEQEVTTPLHEPLLPAMRSSRAQVVGRGSFYMVERKGEGEAVLYRLPDGRLALRLNRFATDPNTDLFVWLSQDAKPKTTAEVFKAKHTVLSGLKSTLGDQNYLLPRGLDAQAIRSIVVWCNPVQIAYAAA
ncbi:MAG: DM13 domain-containing protein, partial [Actinomycetota bacterium]|nr:DM13 domain-containing protein [Actinomycetota bacterium]